MQFRIRHPNGETRVVQVDPTVDDLPKLEREIVQAFALPPHATFQLLLGQQPPKPLLSSGNGGGTSLASMGLDRPQVLIISELPPSLAKAKPKSAKPKPAKAAAAAATAPKRKKAKVEYNDDGDEDDGSYDS